ncbi:efflux RND transporter periplasmic adaptor subunit [Mangrovibacterium diazotrophicum]|uniref:Multidrug efflux pump subunit AcrA (Membrane-fusion protein) n=1 Tax=Mangrovibacterium diazotrophicum TaxID=1261403 RepID=A0A419W8J0_9BACT|nr:HlyD family efflux transporter periplasmic adaptor subunit [Mangrovibacterium diazotrophicum]RKD91682.1 multidrug efflux pump subunit AcrA (membrane-fusion protein) [Mangrovibacterium diazotrophicum]
MKKKKNLLFLLIPVVLLILILVLSSESEKSIMLTAQVQRGDFQVAVYSSGQIESENKENIPVPAKLSDRSLRIWSLKITELVEEGTYVDSGDFVARLDPEAVQEQIKNVQDEMDKAFSEYEDAKIDSNLNLSNQRDAITNARLDMEEKDIIVKESIYESPSIQKKAQMDYDKAERKLEQEKNAYVLKTQQEENKVNRQFINFRQLKERYEGLEGLYNSLTITAPKAGIVTYIKNPWGITKVGSDVGSNGSVATIPDMTNLISRTYINEIDISKIKEGQKTDIGIDAFPDKEMTGEVVSIANIGQTMPNSDAKVFEVKIKVFGVDKDLKPAMTTSNIVYTNLYTDTLYIPIDAVFENDSMQYVYVDRGNISRQVVRLGESNENYVLISEGLKEGDVICLNEPETGSELPLKGTEIYQAMVQEKEEQRKQAEEEISKAEKTQKDEKPGKVPPTKSGGAVISN